MSKDVGGCAFPWVENSTNVDRGERIENYGDAGMTLRDYFAAKAPITFEQVKQIYGDDDPDMQNDMVRATVYSIWALARYEYADAMLREKKDD